MLLGKVVGTLTACVVYEGLESVPLLLIQPLDKKEKPTGSPIVAADSTRMAGLDELIYYEGGREAAMTLEETFVPVDASIIGIVDEINLTDEVKI